jgi:hypothetical protein
MAVLALSLEWGSCLTRVSSHVVQLCSYPPLPPHPFPADLLLTTYVELHGSELSQLVQGGMSGQDWLSLPPPSAPQPLWQPLLQRLAVAEAEVTRLLDSSGRQQGGF